MIPRQYKRDQLVGRKVRCDIEIRNGAGEVVGAGSVAKIKNVVRGKGITIQTEKCPHCGQSAYIRGVDRSILTLVPDRSEE